VSFGQNVRRLRKQSGLSQGDLAAKMGVKQGTLSDWERDRRGLPEAPTLLKVAKAMGCSVDDLLVGVDADYDLSRHTASPDSPHADAASSRHAALAALQDATRAIATAVEALARQTPKARAGAATRPAVHRHAS